jgi:hypothetical protein
MSDEWIDQFIASVKEVAFDIPAPNTQTPLLVELCLKAERIRAEENFRKETAQLSGCIEGLRDAETYQIT